MGNSFGCSASGERLVSAARDGDFQEAQALLECNPRLAKYSTFGVRNSPLHFSAIQGHNEVGVLFQFLELCILHLYALLVILTRFHQCLACSVSQHSIEYEGSDTYITILYDLHDLLP